MASRERAQVVFRKCGLFFGGFAACSALSGCMIAGYNGSGDDMVWPGGLALVFILLVVLWFLLRRR